MVIRLDDPFYSLLTDYEHDLSSGLITEEFLQAFVEAVWAYYRDNKRFFVWRNTDNPYYVVVSEIMLQQTQTQRVAQKFEQFIAAFPTFELLAQAPTARVLQEWVGLGYNRRALALQGIAQNIFFKHGGKVPTDHALLQEWKGLGAATASSIVTFAHNKPTIFIETNVRAVFLHIFFNKAVEPVHDKLLMPLIEKTVCLKNPREWYYALMDCGVALKKLYPNPSRKSKHHSRQSRFEGSDRQLRGALVRLISAQQKTTTEEVFNLSQDKGRLEKIVAQLIKEDFISLTDGFYQIKSL